MAVVPTHLSLPVTIFLDKGLIVHHFHYFTKSSKIEMQTSFFCINKQYYSFSVKDVLIGD